MCLCAVCVWGDSEFNVGAYFFIHLQFFNVRPVAFVRNFGFIYFLFLLFFIHLIVFFAKDLVGGGSFL